MLSFVTGHTCHGELEMRPRKSFRPYLRHNLIIEIGVFISDWDSFFFMYNSDGAAVASAKMVFSEGRGMPARGLRVVE